MPPKFVKHNISLGKGMIITALIRAFLFNKLYDFFGSADKKRVMFSGGATTTKLVKIKHCVVVR